MSRLILASAAVALGALLLCAGCAGAPSSSAGGGSITMYGTIDQGITVRN
ncbi:hypothetical protein [Caballeronia ptereochthonis]|uniref:Lipoprotein n=1 Tax=Caballeronia ptereochthonis TaxID=1777144 RepID=A0A157ZAF9_9BURK|nr:hypothetical protein [Caballeronia ptereochthonis]SAK42511.1 hypothetical protein AWB83_00387 [Caballeronia ptereochthonis]